MNSELANKIKSLKVSKGFVVANEKERNKVLLEARQLKRFGKISFDITTKEVEGGFKVIAI